MIEPIVHENEPLTLVGGSDLSQIVLNICLTHAPRVVAADGGADAVLARGLTPLAVIGDMDSLGEAARAAFADRLHPVAEQDTTDFEKCLDRISAPMILAAGFLVEPPAQEISAPMILAAGFLGGRLDHQLAAMNAVFRRRAGHVVLVGADDVLMLLTGPCEMDLEAGMRFALLPFSPVRVATRGLRWDLHDQILAPDGLISSSNAAADGPVAIRPEGPVFLTVPLAGLAAVTAAVRGR